MKGRIKVANKAEDTSRNMRSLKDEQQVRQRPGVIFGTNDDVGAFNGVFEIIANSIDEAREGYGGEIRVTVEENNVITVEDDGRGLPMDWNDEEKKYNWELALCTLYASGKYDDSQYSTSLGLNGLGLTAMQYASSFMDVWSTYGGKTRYMHFEKGVPKGKMQVASAIREGTGTKIKFQPDIEVFPALRTVTIPAEKFIMTLGRQAMLLPKLRIILNHYELPNEVVFYYEHGPVDYLDDICDKRMLSKTLEFYDSATGTDNPDANPDPYTVKFRIAFNFSRTPEFNGFTEVYHNSSFMFEGGVTVDAFEKGITDAFTITARENGKISSKERFVYRDIADILLCIVSSDAPGNRTYFKNQTKGAINNPFIGKEMYSFVFMKVKFWLDNNKAVADKVMAEVIINKQAREEGAEVSKKVIRSLNQQVTFGNKPKKFVDCNSKSVFERELYIVEGDSALGSVKLARDARTQAIIPVRGKIINCLKEKITRVLNSEIIVDIYRVLGCGMEVKSEYLEDIPKFDVNKLKFGKVIICTDADIDGFHIRTLLLTMLFRLSPSLIKAGKVFIADSPLYEIIYKNGKNTMTKFAYNDAEKEYILQEFKNLGATDKQIKINRSKGLGENDPEMMSVSTMNPATRRLIPVEFNGNDEDVHKYFDALLGDDIETRRELIDQYFELVDGNIE